MKIMSVFEQPFRDDFKYVVAAGGLGKDIACYRSNELSGDDPELIARSGDKLSEDQFKATCGAWDYEADGLYYRR